MKSQILEAITKKVLSYRPKPKNEAQNNRLKKRARSKRKKKKDLTI